MVDGERIPFAALASIQLAPPSYPDWTLAVRAHDGRTRRWRLGAPGADALTPHATHVGLVDALRSAAAESPGLVSFDLG